MVGAIKGFRFIFWIAHSSWSMEGGFKRDTVGASLVAQLVKKPACDSGDLSSLPGLGDPLEDKMATHSSILAWEIP